MDYHSEAMRELHLLRQARDYHNWNGVIHSWVLLDTMRNHLSYLECHEIDDAHIEAKMALRGDKRLEVVK